MSLPFLPHPLISTLIVYTSPFPIILTFLQDLSQTYNPLTTTYSTTNLLISANVPPTSKPTVHSLIQCLPVSTLRSLRKLFIICHTFPCMYSWVILLTLLPHLIHTTCYFSDRMTLPLNYRAPAMAKPPQHLLNTTIQEISLLS